MGVQRLTAFVREHGLTGGPRALAELAAESIAAGRGQVVLVVDGPSFVAWLAESGFACPPTHEQPFPAIYGLAAQLDAATRAFVGACRAAGVELRFFWDGFGGSVAGVHKRSTLLERFEQALLRAVEVEDYLGSGLLPRGRRRPAMGSPAAPAVVGTEGSTTDAAAQSAEGPAAAAALSHLAGLLRIRPPMAQQAGKV
jgi:hypothetical protein